MPSAASFREIVGAMGELIKEGSRRCRYRQFKGCVASMAYRTGKIRGYGACNDNAVGLMGRAPVQKSTR